MKKLQIIKNEVKGKKFNEMIRVSTDVKNAIDELSASTGKTRVVIADKLLRFAIDNCVIVDEEDLTELVIEE
ncbi:hypothetical protein [Peptostreptococcus equinus]|uniref:Ribbon-helix-helix protein, copG family n=1 Tax=Peptostreptococcus equinus TaxID=3003601 RepID=A0ABY7JSV9_9FIRM|nr:hypothetical protein [Peptostreptococcus sp. CBA3647]WAW15248.1 hypothetical protein O0R46_02015 [Peptostreptococcus sp. CBA3647]